MTLRYFSAISCVKIQTYSEVNLIFDHYKDSSLKTTIRDHWQKATGRIQCKILPATNTSTTPMRKILSLEKTKDYLPKFLAEYFIHYSTEQNNFAVTWQENVAATHTDVTMLQTTEEEADTKVLLHAAYVAQKEIKILQIYSPNVNVIILILH